MFVHIHHAHIHLKEVKSSRLGQRIGEWLISGAEVPPWQENGRKLFYASRYRLLPRPSGSSKGTFFVSLQAACLKGRYLLILAK